METSRELFEKKKQSFIAMTQDEDASSDNGGFDEREQLVVKATSEKKKGEKAVVKKKPEAGGVYTIRTSIGPGPTSALCSGAFITESSEQMHKFRIKDTHGADWAQRYNFSLQTIFAMKVSITHVSSDWPIRTIFTQFLITLPTHRNLDLSHLCHSLSDLFKEDCSRRPPLIKEGSTKHQEMIELLNFFIDYIHELANITSEFSGRYQNSELSKAFNLMISDMILVKTMNLHMSPQEVFVRRVRPTEKDDDPVKL